MGVNFIIEDATGDLTYHNNSTEGNPGPDVHSEIDIESVEIDGVSILVSFVATPLDDTNYEYSIRIYWVGDDTLGNWTKCTWSDTCNQVHTRIENGTGGEIIDHYQYGVIGTASKSLVIPIYNTTLIPTILDPHIVAVNSQFRVAEGESYTDELDFATGTSSPTGAFPGFTFWIAMGGISQIIMIGLIMNKKKN